MKVFLDTSVLVASTVGRHPHYPQAEAVMREVAAGRRTGVVAAHSLAETYAVLTRLPLRPAIHPSEARRIVEENIVPHVEVVSLGAKDYREVLREIAEAGFTGGIIYDALLIRCARIKNCDRIYTFDVGDFQRIAPDLSERICAPA